MTNDDVGRGDKFVPDPHWKIFVLGPGYEVCFVFGESDSPAGEGAKFDGLEAAVLFASGTEFPVRFDEKVWQEGEHGGWVDPARKSGTGRLEAWYDGYEAHKADALRDQASWPSKSITLNPYRNKRWSSQ